MELPPSEGNTTILSMVDHFSLAVHFIRPSFPLQLKPETYQSDIFHLDGFPRHIDSDQGPQFTSFCGVLEAKVSFSCRHHPESNGQIERDN